MKIQLHRRDEGSKVFKLFATLEVNDRCPDPLTLELIRTTRQYMKNTLQSEIYAYIVREEKSNG